MTTKKTLFNEDWVNPQINLEWSKIFGAVKGDVYMAYCKLCNRSFSLSNMGRGTGGKMTTLRVFSH